MSLVQQNIRAVYELPLTDHDIGSVTVGTTATNFGSTTIGYKKLFLQADPANTDNIWLAFGGVAAVAGSGICLQPGERVALPIASRFRSAISGTAAQNLAFIHSK